MKYDAFQRNMEDYLRYEVESSEFLRDKKKPFRSWDEILENSESKTSCEKK